MVIIVDGVTVKTRKNPVAPCVICGHETMFHCSSCTNETGTKTHVCSSTNCQETHEKEFHPDVIPFRRKKK